MEKQLNLDEIRNEINSVDDKITELYEKRLELCDMYSSGWQVIVIVIVGNKPRNHAYSAS